MKVILTGGGTGGHLYPALAIADILKKEKQWDVHFVGTKRGLESTVVPESGYPLHTVWIAGLQRGRFVKNVLFPIKMAVSFLQACALLVKLKPGLVVGTGGYVSWPVLAASTFFKIPTAIQEQNQAPGLVTRIFASKVDHVYLSFELSKRFYKNKKNLKYTGNPTRDQLDEGTREQGRAHFNLNQDQPVLFIFGGSQGSKVINEAVLALLPDLMKDTNTQILWGTGPRWYETIASQITEYGPRIHAVPYIREMHLAYHASNLVLCRSGATTVAEITRLGIAAVYIPFQAAAGGHQEENARVLQETGAASMILESELKSSILKETLVDLIGNPGKREAMATLAHQQGQPRAGYMICDYLSELATQR